MAWIKEAQGVIHDIQGLVTRISISSTKESSEYNIYFDVETLDGKNLVVCMDTSGFSICGDEKVYETIYGLLSENCSKFKQTFVESLSSKLSAIQSNQDDGDK